MRFFQPIPRPVRFLTLPVLVAALAICLLLQSPTPSQGVCADITSISIDGAQYKMGDLVKVNKREIEVKVVFENKASHFRISENSNFAGADWQSLYGGRSAAKTKFNLSEGNGPKTVYFQGKRNDILGRTVAIKLELV